MLGASVAELPTTMPHSVAYFRAPPMTQAGNVCKAQFIVKFLMKMNRADGTDTSMLALCVRLLVPDLTCRALIHQRTTDR